jgi:hypothetical protein
MKQSSSKKVWFIIMMIKPRINISAWDVGRTAQTKQENKCLYKELKEKISWLEDQDADGRTVDCYFLEK